MQNKKNVIPNVRNFSFDTVIGKHANKQFKLWHFAREWRLAIILLSLLKVATWIISIYAGFYFLYNVSLPVLGDEKITYIVSLCLLALLEGLVWFFLSKTFKFFLKGIYMTAFMAAIVSGAIYYVSFHMSTNGLAMRQADKADKTELITKDAEIDENIVKKKYDNRIAAYRNEIEVIKDNPGGWIKGKPERLTTSQLRDIKHINFRIDSLNRLLNSELTNLHAVKDAKLDDNNVIVTRERESYYNYVFAIMIAQFVVNFLIMFFWSKIANENDRLQQVNDDIAAAENTIVNNFFAHIAERLYTEASNIQTSIDSKRNIPLEIQNEHGGTTEVAGFSSNKTQTQNSNSRRANIEKIKNGINAKYLGKLRSNDSLRSMLISKYRDQNNNMTKREICKASNAKHWKYYEFYNLLISAGIINENKN